MMQTNPPRYGWTHGLVLLLLLLLLLLLSISRAPTQIKTNLCRNKLEHSTNLTHTILLVLQSLNQYK